MREQSRIIDKASQPSKNSIAVLWKINAVAEGSSIVVFVLVMGTMLALLYLSTTYQTETSFSTKPRLTQDDAIHLVENDFKNRQSDYDRITGIIVNNTSGYVRIEEFRNRNLTLPLVYIDPNGNLIRITNDGYENVGGCNSGLHAYCGYLEPYNFEYKGRLVYGVEVLLSNTDNPPEAESGRGFPFLYVVDANNGEIVDSSFLRSGHINAKRSEG